MSEQPVEIVSDEELLRQAWKEKDRQADWEFHDRWHRRLYRRAKSILHNHADAEECVQVTIMRAALSIDRFGGSFEGWIMTICKHTAIDFLRKRKNAADPEILSICQDDKSLDPAQQSDRNEAIESLNECRDKLDDKAKEVLELYYRRGYTLEQIAETTGEARSTVHERLKGAEETLRRCMTRRGF